MSKPRKSIEETFEILGNTFNSLDIRSLLIKKGDRWVCKFVLVKPTKEKESELQKEYDYLLEDIDTNQSNAEIKFFAESINNFHDILQNLKTNMIKIQNANYPIENQYEFGKHYNEFIKNPDDFSYYLYPMPCVENSLSCLEKIGKTIFGIENDKLDPAFDKYLKSEYSWVIKIPTYCKIYKYNELKLSFHKNLNVSTTFEGVYKNNHQKPLFKKLNLKDPFEHDDFLEYTLDLSSFDLDKIDNKKIKVTHNDLGELCDHMVENVYEFGKNHSHLIDETYNELPDELFILKNHDSQNLGISSEEKIRLLKTHFNIIVNDIDKLPEYETYLKLVPRKLTVVFWDITGFTKLTQDLEAHPDLIVNFLYKYFDTGVDLIFKNSGCFDKFIGDGIMALYGYENQVEYGVTDKESMDISRNGAINALNTAIQFFTEFNKILKNLKKDILIDFGDKIQNIDLKLKCGINTDRVIAGNVSCRDINHITAIGHGVNLASRIADESNGEEILIHFSTYNNIFENSDSSLNQDITKMQPKFIKKVYLEKNRKDKSGMEYGKFKNVSGDVTIYSYGLKLEVTVPGEKVKILSHNLPNEIKAHSYIEASVTVKGTLKNGFLDIVISDPEHNYWYPDPNTYKNNKGILSINEKEFTSSWTIDFNSGAIQTGKGKLTIIVFEDIDGKIENRTEAAKLETDITIM